MYHERFAQQDITSCRHRSEVRNEAGRESAACTLVSDLTGLPLELSRVDRSACAACCRSFVPTREKPNPVVASHVYRAAHRVVLTGALPELSVERAKTLCDACLINLPVLDLEIDLPEDAADLDLPLTTLIPPPCRRHGSVRSWAVGVTTAPRRNQTLTQCLDSLARAGWNDPLLFLDAVGVPSQFAHLGGTSRDIRVGAWPNFCLGLWELLLRRPGADAYMMIQDDSLFAGRAGLREYLEDAVLWPGDAPCLVSLYTSSSYTAAELGWRNLPEPWFWGALAFIFPRELALTFLTDPDVIAHRSNRIDGGLAGVDRLIGNWAALRGVEVWHPTPSLVQHIGITSAIWSFTAAQGPRRADRFVGEASTPGITSLDGNA